MGIVAKQSARNALVLATGLLLGAINTMFVLPAAFEGYEEGWGLIRVMTSWGTILAQVLALGMPNAMLRFLPQAQEGREGNVLSLITIVPALAFALAGLVSIWMGPDALLALDADKGWLLSGRVGAFLWMAGAYLAMLMLRALLIHRMRTVVVTVIQELCQGVTSHLPWCICRAGCLSRRSSNGSCTAMPRPSFSCSWRPIRRASNCANLL